MAFTVYKSGKSGWRLVQREFIDGKRVATAVPKEAYSAIGFRVDMTIDEARERAKQITKQHLVEERKKVQAVKRVEHLKLVDSAYLPKLPVAKFEKHLEDLTMGMSNRLKTVMHHWSTVQKIIVEMELDPKDFYDSRYKIYAYFMKEKFSLDYTGKLLRVFNLWGHFFSKHTNTFFQPIPKPNMNEAQRFVEAREDKTGVRKEALPLNAFDLKNQKSSWSNSNLEKQWNWLFIALWFGLRPTEVDGLKNKKLWKLEKHNETEILMIYQTKLTNISKDKRWKPIPVYFKEQQEALKLVQSGEFKRPLAKTVAKYIGEGFDNYSPRKGFTDLMLERGFSLEDISTFLGHSSIDTTWKHYKNKMTFKLPGKAG